MASQSQSRPQEPPPLPTSASEHDIRAVLTGEALSHLEPCPGGEWKFFSQNEDSIVVVYTMPDGTEVMRTIVDMAVTPEAATHICWQYLHSPNAGFNPGASIQNYTPNLSPEYHSYVMQLNQQFADLNNAWQSHTVVPQSLVMPGPTNAQLSNSGQIPTQAPGQAQPLTQFQASNASLTMPMGPFQNMQPMNVAPNGFGNVAAFQNGNVAAANGNLFPPQNDNDEAVNPESAWGPFNQQA
ncbi:Ff.00g050340.m01.CDS01 [Fusarium sp. VM40]|nr:Ff.00g050340.m01.CDS01 [Fusarium sp. VM40]